MLAYGGTTYAFTYSDEGIRTSKTKSGVTTNYYYSDGLLIGESDNTQTILYIYDAEGAPIGMRYRKHTDAEDSWTTYWFEKNVLGDIVAVYSSSGTKILSYKYDAWGNFTSTTHATDSIGGAAKNPFLYRGYYYDSDLGFYVTGTRYYDPTIGRFISPDSVMSGASGALRGSNLYVYCFNNPIMFTDENGNWAFLNDVKTLVKTKVVDPVCNFVSDVKKDFKNYKKDNDDAQAVLDAKYFSSYEDTFVLKVPGGIGFSFGIIVLGNDNTEADDVKHEYGHKVQLDEKGVWDYTTQVAIPSVVAYWADEIKGLPFDYYTSPWEAEADIHGGVTREKNGRPWTEEDGYYNYLIKLFFD